jgi:hypothetical protein
VGAAQQAVDDLVCRAIPANGNHRPIARLRRAVGGVSTTPRYEDFEFEPRGEAARRGASPESRGPAATGDRVDDD